MNNRHRRVDRLKWREMNDSERELHEWGKTVNNIFSKYGSPLEELAKILLLGRGKERKDN